MTLFRLKAFGVTATLLLSACSNAPGLDWDLRGGEGSLDTSSAVTGITDARNAPDARGVISYPDYQVAVARNGDTVASVAARVGVDANELARFNALQPNDTLRRGEVLSLPGGAAAQPYRTPATTAGTGAVIGSGSGPVDVSAIATTALDRVEPAAKPAPAPVKAEPIRHKVERGETAFIIARAYNVPAKSLAEWNGLGPDLMVREGQYLIIPTAGVAPPPFKPDATPPGTGSPTPNPPSSKKPLPDEKTEPVANKPKETPVSPDLGAERTQSSASKFAMPVDGKIIRGYVKKKTDGIDIAAPSGTAVKAAADGTVAAVTKDTGGTVIVVLSHADGILTVYAGVDGVTLTKGTKVKRGQQIAAVRAAEPAFVHFEVRKGVDSVDPLPYLQ